MFTKMNERIELPLKVCRWFSFSNNVNRVLFWNYFHLVLTKDTGKIHRLMQGCIMTKTKEINLSFILNFQCESFFLYWPIMRFPPWIHLEHFSLMNRICYYKVSFVSVLKSMYFSPKIYAMSTAFSRLSSFCGLWS